MYPKMRRPVWLKVRSRVWMGQSSAGRWGADLGKVEAAWTGGTVQPQQILEQKSGHTSIRF